MAFLKMVVASTDNDSLVSQYSRQASCPFDPTILDLRQSVGALGRREKEILVAVVYEGRVYREVALLYGISPSRVGQILRRIFKKLGENARSSDQQS